MVFWRAQLEKHFCPISTRFNFTQNCVERSNLQQTHFSVIWTLVLSTLMGRKLDFLPIGAPHAQFETPSGAIG